MDHPIQVMSGSIHPVNRYVLPQDHQRFETYPCNPIPNVGDATGAGGRCEIAMQVEYHGTGTQRLTIHVQIPGRVMTGCA